MFIGRKTVNGRLAWTASRATEALAAFLTPRWRLRKLVTMTGVSR
jgi:hypothetical protein